MAVSKDEVDVEITIENVHIFGSCDDGSCEKNTGLRELGEHLSFSDFEQNMASQARDDLNKKLSYR